MSTGRLTTETGDSGASVNVALWPSSRKVRRRARCGLRPVEAALLTRYRPQISGVVLELGSRGDGLTEALAYHAASLTGVAYSAPEADLCRDRYRTGCFEKRNLTDLDIFAGESFDAVVVGRGALDRWGENQRVAMLDCIARLLTDDGVLILSTHNLATESAIRAPLHDAIVRPWRLPGLGHSLSNRSRLGALQQRSHGFAVLNNAHEAYGRLTYHVSREYQERQLGDSAMSLLECVDRCDRHIVSDADSAAERELHFVAQRRS